MWHGHNMFLHAFLTIESPNRFKQEKMQLDCRFLWKVHVDIVRLLRVAAKSLAKTVISWPAIITLFLRILSFMCVYVLLFTVSMPKPCCEFCCCLALICLIAFSMCLPVVTVACVLGLMLEVNNTVTALGYETLNSFKGESLMLLGCRDLPYPLSKQLLVYSCSSDSGLCQ